MTEQIIAVLAKFIISVISHGGYLGVAALMAIESACIPLPSEIIMPFAGYLVYGGQFNLFWAATAGAIGCNLGSVLAYEIGHYGGLGLGGKNRGYVFFRLADLDSSRRVFHLFLAAPTFF